MLSNQQHPLVQSLFKIPPYNSHNHSRPLKATIFDGLPLKIVGTNENELSEVLHSHDVDGLTNWNSNLGFSTQFNSVSHLILLTMYSAVKIN